MRDSSKTSGTLAWWRDSSKSPEHFPIVFLYQGSFVVIYALVYVYVRVGARAHIYFYIQIIVSRAHFVNTYFKNIGYF